MIATTSAGQTNCGSYDFTVGEVGTSARNPFSGAVVPSSATGDYITGIDLKVETSDPRIRQVVAVTTANFMGGQATLNYGITPNSSKGTLVSLRAPAGCAMTGLRVWGSDVTGQIAMHYENILTGSSGTTQPVGFYSANKQSAYQDLRSPPGSYVVKIGGRFNKDSSGSSGDRLCGITIFSRNFEAELGIIRTDSGKTKSCMGMSTAQTSYQPQSSTCEQYMSAFCRSNPGDPSCTCIRSKLAASTYNPICTDSACIASGYKPQTMIAARGQSCPSITTCSQVFDLRDNYGIVDFRNAQFAQNCQAQATSAAAPGTATQTTQTGGAGQAPATSPTPPQTSAPYVGPNVQKSETATPAGNSMTIYIILFIIVVILAIAGTVIAIYWDDIVGTDDSEPSRDDSDTGDDDDDYF